MPMTLQRQRESVFLSREEVTFDKAYDAARADGCRMATFTEVVMNGQFIEDLYDRWVFVDPNGVPTEVGWYRVNRKNKTLEKIPDTEVGKLGGDERLYVHPSALDAAKKGRPPALYVGYDYYRDGLFLFGDYDRDDTARVAEVKLGAPVKKVSPEQIEALKHIWG